MRVMTEAEWLSSNNLYDMLISFPAKWDQRKLWLFGSACLRRQWHLVRDERTQRCAEVAAQIVDGAATYEEFSAAWEAFDAAANQDSLVDDPHLDSYEVIRNFFCFVDPAAALQGAGAVAEAAGGFVSESLHPASRDGWSEAKSKAWKDKEYQERRDQTALLHDIFGNPFRPVTVSPEWRTSTAVALAKQMYESRDFSAMPILADALQDAGCDNDDILAHCRDEKATHVRGCWVVDLVLGKE
jgi:hypothetical protein